MRWSALFVLALAVVAVDQALKEGVRSNLDPGEGMHLFGSYSIQHVQNFGVAGGGLEARALPLAVLAMIVVLGLYEFLAQQGPGRVSLVVGFGLLVGGGLGNLVDRARLGLVTDFIRSGPNAFNVADIAIFGGGIVVLVWLAAALVRMWTHREARSS
ncbi:MAG: signal peptidase II [Actinobacteria bacterium]|nr:signal peptidase II [Actinomycetota bacterium]